MERREAIKNIGLTFGAFVATPTALSLLQSCQTETPWLPGFFSEEEGKVVRKLVDAILPSVDSLPSATEVNVHVFIDKYIKEVMKLEHRVMHRGSLQVVIKSLLAASGKEAVDDLSSDDYNAFLEANLRKSKEEDEAINAQVGEHLAANNEDATGLPDDVRGYSFLTGLRGMAIWAYKTNERVGETILAYASIPGMQDGCVDLQETTGGKAWSL